MLNVLGLIKFTIQYNTIGDIGYFTAINTHQIPITATEKCITK
jgi:hypothetical protein